LAQILGQLGGAGGMLRVTGELNKTPICSRPNVAGELVGIDLAEGSAVATIARQHGGRAARAVVTRPGVEELDPQAAARPPRRRAMFAFSLFCELRH